MFALCATFDRCQFEQGHFTKLLYTFSEIVELCIAIGSLYEKIETQFKLAPLMNSSLKLSHTALTSEGAVLPTSKVSCVSAVELNYLQQFIVGANHSAFASAAKTGLP